MLKTRLILPLAFASVAFMYGCQEQASGPTGPEGSGPLFTHKGDDKPHGKKGSDDDGDKITWANAFAVIGDAAAPTAENYFVSISTCPGLPGSRPANPTVEWNDVVEDETIPGCAQVMPTDGPLLTNDALLIVGAKKGSTKFTIQFLIQDFGGFESTQYRTDKFVIEDDDTLDPPRSNKPFTGEAPFTLHVHKTVTIYRLKGHTGGPKDADVGTINIGDIVYNKPPPE